ncbi:MAG: thioredoxin family protein [Propionibacteriaceae bacterium]
MAIVDVTNETFEQTVGSDGIVLVDFWADWCQPCKRFGPIFDSASDKHSDILFAKMDTDANQQVSESVGIEGIPTLMAFRDGILLFRQAGALSGGQLEQLITQVEEIDMEQVRSEVERLTAEQATKQ